MKRRDFMNILAAGTAAGAIPQYAFSRSSLRKSPRAGGKKMLLIFLRGANDALNTVIPIESGQHSLYMGYRPTLGIPAASTIPTNHSDFGLHPNLAPLQSIHQNGHLSFVHCVGYPNPDRSHFESMAYMETAVPGNTLLQGWLNRYLQNTTGDGGLIRAISIGSTTPQSMMGHIPVPTSNNFGKMKIGDDTLPDGGTPPGELQQLLDDMYQLTPTFGNQEIYDTGKTIFQMVQNFSDRDKDTYVPENGAVYPDTWTGGKIKHAAQMLKDTPSALNVEVASIDMDGYDTHAQQGAADGHPALLTELAGSLGAFYTDMGSTRMNDVLVLVISEFGRRAYENDSAGTDHGTGGVAMVMNNNVAGTVHLGSGWPGLEEGNLYGGDLNWVNDFRDIYWEIMLQHMQVTTTELEQIIPGHSYTPLGIL